MCGKSRQDRIINDNIREKVGVEPIVDNKMVETRIRCFWACCGEKTCGFCNKEGRSDGG
jgi:hypothetical protein